MYVYLAKRTCTTLEPLSLSCGLERHCDPDRKAQQGHFEAFRESPFVTRTGKAASPQALNASHCVTRFTYGAGRIVG